MKESALTRKIMDALRSEPKVWCFKHHATAGSQAGVPDIIACVGGHFVALEVKAAKGRVSPIQEHTLHLIAAAGGNAYVVRSVEEAMTVLESVRLLKKTHKE